MGGHGALVIGIRNAVCTRFYSPLAVKKTKILHLHG
jgi:hypothetical protein